MAVNGYKTGPSLRLRINWKWPQSVLLVLTKRKADSGDEIGEGTACVTHKQHGLCEQQSGAYERTPTTIATENVVQNCIREIRDLKTYDDDVEENVTSK